MKFFKNYSTKSSSLVSYKTIQHNSLVDYKSLAETGYRQNVVVYRVVNLLARSVASVTWLLKRATSDKQADEVIHNHKILDIFEHPNGLQSKTVFIETLISYLLLDGNCYVMANDDNSEMYLLRPDRIRIVPGKNIYPIGYEYSVDNHRQFFEVCQETGKSNILHIKLFNPVDDWYGLSPIEVALCAIKQHNAIATQNTAFLQNGGRPSGALMYKHILSNDQRDDLKRDLRNLYEGGRNAGKLLLLEGDFEWKEMGLSPKDLDFIAGKELSAKEIALAFGVPPILIGIMSHATFSNYREARYHFWEETVIPLLNLITNSFSQWFQYLFKTDLHFVFDIDSIAALSSRRESEWQKINNASFLSQDEKREAFNYSK